MTALRPLLGWTLALLAIPATAAPVHAVLDAHGRLQVSASLPPGVAGVDLHRPHRPARVPRARPVDPPSLPAPAVSPQRARMQALVDQVATEFAIDAALLHAIVQVESNYNPQATSRAGALGLMQVIPATGRRFGVHDLFDPLQNLRAGAAYLVWLDRHFEGDLPMVLAAYNAGEGAVRRHGRRVPPYAETHQYIQRVTERYAHTQRDAYL